MSIIYEALQKVERSKAGVVLPKPKAIEPEIVITKTQSNNTRALFLALFGALLIAAIFVVPRYAFKPWKRTNFKKPPVDATGKVPEVNLIQDKPVSILDSRVQTEEKPTFGTYLLQGIVYDAQLPSAIINGKTLRVSDSVDGFQVREITPTTVKLVNPKDNSELTLSF